MVLYAEKKGLQVVQYRDNIKDLKNNNPVVIFVDYGIWVYQQNYFMVIISIS